MIIYRGKINHILINKLRLLTCFLLLGLGQTHASLPINITHGSKTIPKRPSLSLSPASYFPHDTLLYTGIYRPTLSLESPVDRRQEHQSQRQSWREELINHLNMNKQNIETALKRVDIQDLEFLIKERLRLEEQKRLLDEEKEEDSLCLEKDFKRLTEKASMLEKKVKALESENMAFEEEIKRVDMLMPDNEMLQTRLACVLEEKEVLMEKFYELSDLEAVLNEQIETIHQKHNHLQKIYENLLEKQEKQRLQFDLEIDRTISASIPEELYNVIGKEVCASPTQKQPEALERLLTTSKVTYTIYPPSLEPVTIETGLPTITKGFIERDLGFSKG
jgi:hypothetical protein